MSEHHDHNHDHQPDHPAPTEQAKRGMAIQRPEGTEGLTCIRFEGRKEFAVSDHF